MASRKQGKRNSCDMSGTLGLPANFRPETPWDPMLNAVVDVGVPALAVFGMVVVGVAAALNISRPNCRGPHP